MAVLVKLALVGLFVVWFGGVNGVVGIVVLVLFLEMVLMELFML